MCFSIFPFHPSPPLFLLSPLPAKSMFPCDHQNIFVLNYCKYNDLKSCVMFACCPALIVSPSALSNTFLLLSLLFLITIYTGWMDDIPFAEYKYTPILCPLCTYSVSFVVLFLSSLLLYLHYPHSFPLLPLPPSLPLSNFPQFIPPICIPLILSFSISPYLHLPFLNIFPRSFFYPIPSRLSFQTSSFHFPSLPINIFPSFHLPSPLLRSTPSLPLPTYRTIRRSTWSTYTAGLTACAPRTKAPTSSSPPLPSI